MVARRLLGCGVPEPPASDRDVAYASHSTVPNLRIGQPNRDGQAQNEQNLFSELQLSREQALGAMPATLRIIALVLGDRLGADGCGPSTKPCAGQSLWQRLGVPARLRSRGADVCIYRGS